MTSEPSNFPVLRGRAIRVDDNGFVCLNDIWSAAGYSKHQTPSDWKELPMTGRLIVALLDRNTEKSGIKNYNPKTVIYGNRGKGGGTYADMRLALSYAEYLNPKLALEVKEVFLRYKAADPTLADDILQRATPEANEWAARRAMGRAVRADYTATLKGHGVSAPVDFALCTNAVYEGLFGKTAKQLKQAKGVTKGLRDAMDIRELAFVMASEALSSERIEEQKCDGAKPCREATRKSARAIKDAIDSDRRDRTALQPRLV